MADRAHTFTRRGEVVVRELALLGGVGVGQVASGDIGGCR